MAMAANVRRPRHAVYLLPNAFTTAALFAGFFATLEAIRGNWQIAAIAVIIAALLDACDGRVARWTGTQSSFGEEYDSLADMISFGAAPALLLYQWALVELGKIGISVAFCYCAATAMRLARFNVSAGSADRRFFIGLPSPAAAIWVVSFVATMDSWDVNPHSVFMLSMTGVITVIAACTMVIGVRYYSFKEFNIKKRVPFRYIALFFLVVAMLYLLTDTLMEVLLSVLSIYLLSGYAYALWKMRGAS